MHILNSTIYAVCKSTHGLSIDIPVDKQHLWCMASIERGGSQIYFEAQRLQNNVLLDHNTCVCYLILLAKHTVVQAWGHKVKHNIRKFKSKISWYNSLQQPKKAHFSLNSVTMCVVSILHRRTKNTLWIKRGKGIMA